MEYILFWILVVSHLIQWAVIFVALEKTIIVRQAVVDINTVVKVLVDKVRAVEIDTILGGLG